MSLNSGATIIPGRGTIFVAGPHTAPFDKATVDAADPATYVGWECLGHTSRDNTVSLSKSGGDSTIKGSWYDENLYDSRAGVSFAFTANSIQVDYLTLSLAFPGGTVASDGGFVLDSAGNAAEKAVYVLMYGSGANRMGIYGPRVSLALGDAPSISVDSFFEIQLSGSFLSATETVGTTGIVSGKPLKIYPPVALTAPNPTVTSATPAAATTGSTLTINGLNMGGVTAVTVGGVAGTGLVQDNANRVRITMPSGSAGSAPIVVTNPVGASAAYAYSRGA